MKDDKFIEKAINWAQKKGFSDIRAVHEGFEAPKSFTRKEDESTVTPDLSGLKTGGKSYVEIALKTDNVQRKITKWKLLSTLASVKGGKLYLLAPRGHKAFTDNLVKTYNIDAKVVSI